MLLRGKANIPNHIPEGLPTGMTNIYDCAYEEKPTY